MIDIQILAAQFMFFRFFVCLFIRKKKRKHNGCRKQRLSETTKQCTQHMAPIDINDASAEIYLKPSCLIYCIYKCISIQTSDLTIDYSETLQRPCATINNI